VTFLAKGESGLKEHPKPPKHGGKGAKLLQHKHCQVCSKAIPLSEEFCSEECKVEFEALVKKRRMYIYIMYGMIILIIVVMLLSMFSGS
jgi:predicted nucleic acid-binding Zn ribbon protein